MSTSYLETQFIQVWLDKYPRIDLVREYKFCPGRMYRFDFAHPVSRVAIEVQGGRWYKSGHTSGEGIERDCMKMCLAASTGWLVFPLTDSMIDPKWLKLVARTIQIRTSVRK